MHSEPVANHEDTLNTDEDMAHPTSRISGPFSSITSSRTPTPFLRNTWHGRMTPSSLHTQHEDPILPPPPPPPVPSSSSHSQRKHPTPLPPQLASSSSHIQYKRTTPPPSHIQSEHTIPPPSLRIQRMRATLSSWLTTPSPHSEANRDGLPPRQPHAKPPPAPFHEGYSPGPKPKAGDYQDDVKRMLLRAMHEYACLILTTDAFPNERRQTQWAESTWQGACEEFGVHYECSVHMIRLVRLWHHYWFIQLNIDMT